MVFQDFNLIENISSINNVLTGLLFSSNVFLSLFYLFNKKQKLQALDCLKRVGLLENRIQGSGSIWRSKTRIGVARAIKKARIVVS